MRPLFPILVTCFLLRLDCLLGQEVKADEFEKKLAMDFKLSIGRWAYECYYQQMEAGEILHVVVAVINGGDQKVDLLIEEPSGNEAHASRSQVYSSYDSSQVAQAGDYKICVRNPQSYQKQIYLSISVSSNYELMKKKQENAELEDTTKYMREKLIDVWALVMTVRRYQNRQIMNYAGDSYRAEMNNSYIMYRSIWQICLILSASLVQTFFIKKLFQAPKSIYPRA